MGEFVAVLLMRKRAFGWGNERGMKGGREGERALCRYTKKDTGLESLESHDRIMDRPRR